MAARRRFQPGGARTSRSRHPGASSLKGAWLGAGGLGWAAATGLSLILALSLALPGPAPVHAQEPEAAEETDIPTDSLEGAIGRCIGKEGATGDAVGDIMVDLKTGKVVYRCDSEPDDKARVLVPGRAPQAEAQAPAPAVPGAKPPSGTVEPAADFGADPAYVNHPMGDPPRRPQDCVGAHPYYMTFPACVIARKMGLLTESKPEPKAATAARPAAPSPGSAAGSAAGPEAETTTAGPADHSASDATASAEGGSAEGHDTAPNTGHDAASKADAEARAARTIGPLPEGAEDAAAQASAHMDAQTTDQGAADGVSDGPVGSVRETAEVEEPIDWMAIALWVGAVLGGLLSLAALGLAVVVLINRSKLRRDDDPDDPFEAFFDDPAEALGTDAEAEGPDDDLAALAAFADDDGPMVAAKGGEPGAGAAKGPSSRAKKPQEDPMMDDDKPLAGFTA